MKELIKLPFRVAFMPIALIMLGGTAFLEFLGREPDWVFWRDYNRGVISTLPFKIDLSRDNGD